MELAGVLPGWLALSHCHCSSVRLQARGRWHATLGRPREWRPHPAARPHLAVRMILFTTFIHAHCQGCDYRKLGSRKDKLPWPGAHHQLLVCPRLALQIITPKYVSGQFSTAYRSTIGTDFITKTLPHHSKPDESVTLQIWVCHLHYSLGLFSKLPPSLTRP